MSEEADRFEEATAGIDLARYVKLDGSRVHLDGRFTLDELKIVVAAFEAVKPNGE